MIDQAAFTLTDHARWRMAQRNVTAGDILYILRHGYHIHRAGAVLVHLRRKDMPLRERANDQISRLEGVTIVLNRATTIVLTVWRNRKAGLCHIRRKSRYDRPEN
jgi:hypothetical protein